MDGCVAIPGYEGYYVTREGRVYSDAKKKFLTPTKDKTYAVVSVKQNDTVKTVRVHRLVALTFLPNDDPSKDIVNHKDGNKLNNHVDNLEWCTHGENMKHAADAGLIPKAVKFQRKDEAKDVDHQNWKTLPNNDKYKISPDGDIYSLKYKIILKSFIMTNYQTVTIKRKNYFVHRLVAAAYVPNPDNLPVVNHKDGNKLNNKADNLEWTTVKANVNHARKTGLNKGNGHGIKQVSKLDGTEKTYLSIRDAHLKTKFSRCHIEQMCRGEPIQAVKDDGDIYNYEWSFINEEKAQKPEKEEPKIRKPIRAIEQVKISDGTITRHPNMCALIKATGYSKTNIKRACAGEVVKLGADLPSFYEYQWRYEKFE